MPFFLFYRKFIYTFKHLGSLTISPSKLSGDKVIDEPICSKELAERMITVMHLFAHAIKNRLPPHEMCIAPNQLHILKMVSQEPMTISEMARAHHVSTPTMSSVIDKLEKNELLKRERSTEDRRVVHAGITKKGEELMSKMFERFIKEVSQILEPMPSEDKIMVMKGFEVLHKAISDELSSS